MKFKLLILALLIQTANIAMGYTITGNVTSNGEPLIGALIMRVGVGNGGDNDVTTVITDIDGNYSIESGNYSSVVLVAQYVSHKSQLVVTDSYVVNFELEELPEIPVDFIRTILENSALIEYTLNPQIHSIGGTGSNISIYLSNNTLVFALMTDRNNASTQAMDNFATTAIKGYIQQMKNDGTLNTFLDQMQTSGMKWAFGVYSTSKNKWLGYKEYDADQLRKFL